MELATIFSTFVGLVNDSTDFHIHIINLVEPPLMRHFSPEICLV